MHLALLHKRTPIGSVLLKLLFPFVLYVTTSTALMATHLRAGEITAAREDCSSLTFLITITVYTDSEGGDPVLFGSGTLNFGDDTFFVLPNEIRNNTQVTRLSDGTLLTEPLDGSGLGQNVAIARFVIEHTYQSASRYILSYGEQNRNPGVLNIDNSVNTSFFIETQVFADPLILCNNTPVLSIPPIDRGCTGVAFFHNPGATDPDRSDSLAFELVVPKRDIDLNVVGYRPINDESFYEDFSRGDETGTRRPDFFIDPITGEITWDAPGRVGEYNIAFKVQEFRKVGDEYFPLGFVVRDMQIIVEDCDNNRPELEIPEHICVVAGEEINATIFGTDPDNDDVQIEVISEVLGLGAQVTPPGGPWQASNPRAELQFSWQTECLDVSNKPYRVFFRIRDNPPSGPKLVSFATWFITVVPPPPVIADIVYNNNAVDLTFDQYTCQNADLLEVWRRVDENPYQPDSCETGIRSEAGYVKIAEVPASATTYRDTNVAAAAKYCYRLLAVFEKPEVMESIVSQEKCLEFIPADVPVITHVSVIRTDSDEGEIAVAWRPPFDLVGLALPHTYSIERQNPNGTFTPLSSVVDQDSQRDSIGFIDTNINTLDEVFTYRIAIVNSGGVDLQEVLYSAQASSVRLTPTSSFGSITLNWQANVPWSNTIASPPDNEHLIYRGFEDDLDQDFELIATVDVSDLGFQYVDTDVAEGLEYCYRVLTKGTYGNPNVISPLLNFSQVICAQTNDSIPPCVPTVSVSGLNCEQFVASQACQLNNVIFENTIIWETPTDEACGDDIKEYRVFYAPIKGGVFNQIAVVEADFFTHEKPDSFKGCYKIKAVDFSGNESEFSEEYCVDNCPNYVFPNVFTPDNGDVANDVFKPFGPESDVDRCARFVLGVKLEVFNRWGKKVFEYTGSSKSENSNVFINWDGRNQRGENLSSGVYYYLAEVTYDVVDPAKSTNKLKGWVQIIR